MTDFRKNLINKMTATYGLEAHETIFVARMCEVYPDKPKIDVHIEAVVENFLTQRAKAMQA